MDIGLWLGIVALVLAIPLGIATNLLTPRVVAHLERRKLLKSNRTKTQALAEYKRIQAFKNGTRDKYPYYILLATVCIICAIAVATCIILAVLRVGEFADFPNPLLLIAFLFFLFVIVFLVIIAETARRLENFERYQAEIRKKWGKNSI